MSDTMTDDEMRREILTVLGWKVCTTSGSECWISPDRIHTTSGNVSLPDPLTDLNAMHEAENALNANQCYDYHAAILALVYDDNSFPMSEYAIHATARQRAEAFLRTIGKLK